MMLIKYIFLICLLYSWLHAERLIFTIDYLGISVANVEIIYQEPEISEKSEVVPAHTLTVTARSTGVSNFFSQSFDNTYKTFIDSLFRPIVYVKNINQRNFREDSETVYCFVDLQAVYHNRVTNLNHLYRIQENTRDFFSGLFYLRTKDLRNDITFTVDAAGKIWILTSRFLGTESIRTSVGRLRANMIEVSFTPYDNAPRLRSDVLTNNLVSEDNRLLLWFTDDARQIPVRASYIMQPFNVNWTIRGIR